MSAAATTRAGSRITAVRRDLHASWATSCARRGFALLTFGRVTDVELPSTSDRVAYDDEVRALQVEPADAGVGTSVGRPVRTDRE